MGSGDDLTSVGAVFEVMEAFKAAWTTDGVRPLLWYRGQPRSALPLQPGLLRVQRFINKVGEERRFNSYFLRRGVSMFPDGLDLVGKYFLAQHHGLPTRLLDWCTNPLAALFFAVSSNETDDGEFFILCPKAFTDAQAYPAALRSAYELTGSIGMRDPLVQDAVAFVCTTAHTSEPPQVIVPLLPDLFAGRMLQQGACFTLHMPRADEAPLDATAGHYIGRYRIPAECKLALRRALGSAHVNAATLFADLDGLARDLRWSWTV